MPVEPGTERETWQACLDLADWLLASKVEWDPFELYHRQTPPDGSAVEHWVFKRRLQEGLEEQARFIWVRVAWSSANRYSGSAGPVVLWPAAGFQH